MAMVGEIVLWSGSKVPVGWRVCDGSVVPIDNTTYALINITGYSYGGGGNSFELPNLEPVTDKDGRGIICLQGDFPAMS